MPKAQGGRQVYEDMDKYGNIYDHFAIAYQWESGTRGYHFSRQQNGTAGSYEVELYGQKGFCSAKNRHAILAGDDAWRYRGEDNDMYQTEHDTLLRLFEKAARPLTTGSEPSQHNGCHSWQDGCLYGPEDHLCRRPCLEEDLTPPHLDWKQELQTPKPRFQG